jgi:hypothetical protein
MTGPDGKARPFMECKVGIAASYADPQPGFEPRGKQFIFLEIVFVDGTKEAFPFSLHTAKQLLEHLTQRIASLEAAQN